MTLQRQFRDEFLQSLGKWLQNEREKAQARVNQSGGIYETLPTLKSLSDSFPLLDEAGLKAMTKLVEPWVNQWALGSEAMAAWIVSYCLLEVVKTVFNLSNEQLNRQIPESLKNIVDFISVSDQRFGWAWKVLLTDIHSRAEGATRAVARKAVIQGENYRRQEIATAESADIWVKVRILDYTETQIATEMKDKIDSTEISNISARLQPFDKALGFTRQPGAPKGKTRLFR